MKHAVPTEQSRADWVTRQWWFYVPFSVGVSFLPPIMTRPPPLREWLRIDRIYMHLFANHIDFPTSPPWVVVDILPIVLVVGLLVAGNRLSRLLSVYAAIAHVLFMVFQNVSVTDRYGIGIMTPSVVWCLTVAGFWAWEAVAGFNDFTPRPRALWKYWVVPVALFAFWLPLRYSRADGSFYLSLLGFASDHTGLGYCLMTPVFLAILTLYYPTVNLALLRVSATAGVILGVLNMEVAFLFTRNNWFHGVVHLPLLLISVYALVLSCKRPRPAAPAPAADDSEGS